MARHDAVVLALLYLIWTLGQYLENAKLGQIGLKCPRHGYGRRGCSCPCTPGPCPPCTMYMSTVSMSTVSISTMSNCPLSTVSILLALFLNMQFSNFAMVINFLVDKFTKKIDEIFLGSNFVLSALTRSSASCKTQPFERLTRIESSKLVYPEVYPEVRGFVDVGFCNV